jgi:hypothetical protein
MGCDWHPNWRSGIMKYKIIEINELDHSIVVRFYSEIITEEMLSFQKDEAGNILRGRTDYSFDLPIPAPRGVELDDFIIKRSPREWFEKQENVLDPNIDTSLAFLSASLGVEKNIPDQPTAPIRF